MPPPVITRPTTDRVREALMSMLLSRCSSFESFTVLDAFAGSGALGLELLSREASFVEFYEKDLRAYRVLQANVQSLDAARRARLCHQDVLAHPPLSGLIFDLVLLDPPYAMEPERIAHWLAELDRAGVLAADAMVSYEHAESLDLGLCGAFESLELKPLIHKRYGDIAVDLFRKEHR